ncbi:MAG TPA: polysaccharide pyruvyl transferase family protein [Rubrobacter sp.]
MDSVPDGIRVCQWGTSDAANYGDQLFPLIAEEQLTARLPGLELTCYAPIGDATLPPGSPPLSPLIPGGGSLDRERREYFARHFDAILIGGGDILRFDRSEPGYGDAEHEGPLRPYDPFLDFSWAETGPNILWNAPGVPFPFEPSRRLLVRLARSHVRYAAVRDEVSRGYLLEAGVEEPVHVYPDTGILLAEIIRRRADWEMVRGLLPRGAGVNGRRSLCFQCAPGFLRRQEELVAKSLARIAAGLDLEIVLLPIGLCHGDQDALRLIQRESGNRFTLVEGLEAPLEIGAVIGACDYFVGSSLHGNLTALSFGIPHLVVNNPVPSVKLEGLIQLAGLEEFRITDWGDLENSIDRLAATPRERWAKAGDRLKTLASEHFDRLADEISRSASERREPAGTPHATRARRAGTKVDGNIPLDVYETIAGLHERLDDERAAWRATEAELRNELLLQRSRYAARVEHLKTRGEALEARRENLATQLQNLKSQNENLKTQSENMKARNENLSNDLRDIEESTTWRLFGPYRRLRAKMSPQTKSTPEETKGSPATRSD